MQIFFETKEECKVSCIKLVVWSIAGRKGNIFSNMVLNMVLNVVLNTVVNSISSRQPTLENLRSDQIIFFVAKHRT